LTRCVSLIRTIAQRQQRTDGRHNGHCISDHKRSC